MKKTLFVFPGQRFGKLTVIKEISTLKDGKHIKNVECVCDCGNHVERQFYTLVSKKSTSCGCYRHDNKKITHGMRYTALYRVWIDMKRRCDDPRRPEYKNYGGRGISVCPEWYDFIVFKEWSLGNGYKEDLLIDRIEVNGNYSPGNCRYVTRYESELNKRRRPDNNIRFHHGRFEVSMSRYGVHYYCGSFKTIEEARIARDEKQKQLLLTCK